MGAYIKTEGINTNPANDDEKWKLNYTFYNSSDVLIGKQEVEIDQSTATSDWVELDGTVILPEEATTLIVDFIGGKNAVGTVWADAFEWPTWNRTLELPTGWFNWFPFDGEGLDLNVAKGFENTRVTTDEAHSGLHSVMFDLPFDRESQDAFVATKRALFGDDIQAGDVVRISVWLKAENLVPDSAAKYPDGWSVGLTPLTFAGVGNNDGYDVVWGPDLHFKFPAVTSFDWTEYYEDIVVPEGGNALEVRLHAYNRFTGKIYWDDLKVEKIDIPEISGIGGLEGDSPSFWNKGSEPASSSLEWAKDESFVLSRSLKITKSVTDEAAMWTSDNMVDIWSPKVNSNEEIKLGAYIKTEGINTNPANDDEKWKLNYTFYNSSDVLIGKQEVEIDQSTATSDWVELDGTVILPEEATTLIVDFIGGKNAVGTVWADAFEWPTWNRTLELPTGWFNWFPFDGEGLDLNVAKGFENTRVTTDEAHSGLHSVMFDLPFDRESQDAFVATKRALFGDDIQAGDVVRISVWLKAENLVPDSAAKYPDGWSVGLTPLTFAGVGNNDGYDVVWGPDLHFKFPAVTSFDWTEYYEDIVVPEGGNALEVRLHAYNRFTGKIYWDDLKVEKIDIPEISGIGGLEGDSPSFWNKGSEPASSSLEWAKDESFVLSRSLKITKSVTDEAAMWTSDNMVDIWSPKVNSNEEIKLGAYIKTEGINTNPANDDEKWKLNYTFYNSSDVLIGKQEVEIDQSTATSDWVELDGTVILPEEATTLIVDFIGGKNAVGTVWADAFEWPTWNRTLELPTGWFNWFPFDGEGLDLNVAKGFENTRVTTDEAHSGLHSVMFDLPFDRESQDAFVATKRALFGDDIQAGDVVRISVWLKAENLVPDSAAKYPDGWSVGLTPLTFAGVGNNDGYDVVWGPDLHFKFPAVTSFDWTEYYEDIVVPEGGNALEVRLHAYNRFTGKIYWDDLKVEKIGTVTGVELFSDEVPTTYDLSQNYPNPFNPSTTIRYSIPTASHVTVKIFNMLGQEVKTLIDIEQSAGVRQVQWNGDNNYGSKVSSGIYIYAVKANDFYQAKKMIMLK